LADQTTWIKIDRNILRWGWYKDNNTKALFIHLLLMANIKPNMFMGVQIGRGELATSYKSLSEQTGLTYKQVRTALEHLKWTGEAAVKKHPKFSVISIVNYDLYQARGQSNGQSEGSQRAVKGQQSKNIRKKEVKNIYTRAREEDEDYSWEADAGVPKSLHGQFESAESYQRWLRGEPEYEI